MDDWFCIPQESSPEGDNARRFCKSGYGWSVGPVPLRPEDFPCGRLRGEVLALRWSDIAGGRVTIARSLSQTKAGLMFKGTKSERLRTVPLPSELAALEAHRK